MKQQTLDTSDFFNEASASLSARLTQHLISRSGERRANFYQVQDLSSRISGESFVFSVLGLGDYGFRT